MMWESETYAAGEVRTGAEIEPKASVAPGQDTECRSENVTGELRDRQVARELATMRPRTSLLRNDYETGEQGVTVPTTPNANFSLRASCAITVTPLRVSVSSGGISFIPGSQLSVTASSRSALPRGKASARARSDSSGAVHRALRL
jgi:hypothetical protein